MSSDYAGSAKTFRQQPRGANTTGLPLTVTSLYPGLAIC
jgi:hypothetical protein